MYRWKITLICMIGSLLMGVAHAAQWSNTEIHVQYGDLKNFQTGDDESNTILTFQHASGWKYGSNFFFIDHITVDSGTSFYGEWYPVLSSNKLMGFEYGSAIRDVGLVLGFNAAPDANVLKYLPGIQVDWNIAGFAFFNTALTAYIDQSDGLASGGAPKEDDSYMFDIAWKYPFDIGNQSFSIEGHVEYIDGRDFDDVIEGESEDWILAQPQFRWDAGKAFSGEPGQLYLGIEYQYWENKLGGDENESVVQLLLVWGL